MAYIGKKPTDVPLSTSDLDDDSVTYAKIQNVASDERILGRVSGADGVIEELTKAQVLTFANVEDGADVTDATNVAAAGALMDSECAGLAAVKATTGTFLTADQTKLDGIETSATADQSAGEILTLIEDGVDSVHYVDGSIDNVHLADDAVDSDELASGAVDNDHISGSAAIATSKLSGAVTSIGSHGLATSATTDMTDMGNAASGTLAVARGGTGTTTYTALMNAIDDGSPDSDHTATGPQTNTLAAGYSTTIMDLVYLGSSSKWLEADSDATGTSINLLGIALEAKTDTQAMNVALPGSFVRDDTWNWTPGVPLYVSGTLGAITATKPTGSGDVVRTVGFAVHADMIYFNPSFDYVTLA